MVQAAEELKAGRPAGVLQLTSVLRRADGIALELQAIPEHEGLLDSVTAEWTSSLSDVMAKADLKAVRHVMEQYGEVVAAAKGWPFDKLGVQRIRSSEPDASRTADINMDEKFVLAGMTRCWAISRAGRRVDIGVRRGAREDYRCEDRALRR